MKNISLSHIDMDGVTCQIVISKNLDKVEYLNCNYNNINEYLDIIQDMLLRYSIHNVFITDLSLNKNIETIIKNMALNNINTNFIIIDHHPESLLFDIKLKNVIIIVDTKYSASKLTYSYFNNKPESINKFINIVNDYDIWNKESDNFMKGMEINDLFWKYKLKSFFVSFSNPNKDRIKKDIEETKILREKHFTSLLNKGLIKENNESFLSFNDKFLGWDQLYYPDKRFYINATSFGKIQIRLDDSFTQDESNDIQNLIKNNMPDGVIENIGGHRCAFSLSHINKYSSEEIVKYTQIVYNAVKEIYDRRN